VADPIAQAYVKAIKDYALNRRFNQEKCNGILRFASATRRLSSAVKREQEISRMPENQGFSEHSESEDSRDLNTFCFAKRYFLCPAKTIGFLHGTPQRFRHTTRRTAVRLAANHEGSRETLKILNIFRTSENKSFRVSGFA